MKIERTSNPLRPLSNPSTFPEIRFKGQLRPSQAQVLEIAERELAAGNRRLHIVAPPGSGKTVLGLYLWAELIKVPCLVLSPNSAIQSQWAARTDLFEMEHARSQVVSTDPQQAKLLTSLTYQSVTMPARNLEAVDEQAVELWIDKLLEHEQVTSREEAEIWIGDLKTNNPDYFGQQFGSFRKKVRDEASRAGNSIELLHASSQETLYRLKEQDVGLVILDECHHLLGHWGRVLSDALKLLDHPMVIGLTATPPDRQGKNEIDVERYDRFFGEIDFDVPVPAVVKDGYLAPYQDLAYFVRPTSKELKFIASADKRLNDLVDRICAKDLLAEAQNVSDHRKNEEAANQPSNVIDWLATTLGRFRLPAGEVDDWNKFARRDPALALAGRQFLGSRDVALPESVPQLGPTESFLKTPPMEYLIPVIDRFVRHFLRRSPSEDHQRLAKELTASLRTLGVQITDTGTRPCVSPVGRVLAYSNSKTDALIPILHAEMENLGESIRAVVIADFERSSAVTAQLKDLMDEETGGAIAAFKKLLTCDLTDTLEPVLLTGSTILIDDEIEEQFLSQSREWIKRRQLKVQLDSKPIEGFHQILGSGKDWAPRVYVELVTELFQNGLTKCLIGTRGLLGEGWDANKINVLVDLTTVTTSMSINQLRGRSFRLDPGWKEKLANNWDVVCIAPEFSKGFDDYKRFKGKHKNLYGVTDDGTIEKGVGHVHPAFTDIKPEGLEDSVAVLNAEMVERSKKRSGVRELWKIGQPFQAKLIKAVELKLAGGGGFPPFKGSKEVWSDATLTSAIATAVLESLAELGHVGRGLVPKLGELSGGYIRVFLNQANDDESRIFTMAMKQVLGPLDRPRYVIPRVVERREDTFWSKIMPSVFEKYFQKSFFETAMLHAVPDALAKNKNDVQVFQKHWNRLVSSGDAVYAHRGEGERMVNEAKKSLEQETILHDKEVFV